MRNVMIRVMGVLVFFGLAACGGSQLTPEQQQEYDQLATKKSELRGSLSKVKSKSESTFKRLGKLEKKHKAVAKGALGCGVDPGKQAFGPLPFVHKKGYRAKIVKTGARSVGSKKCLEYKLKVVK